VARSVIQLYRWRGRELLAGIEDAGYESVEYAHWVGDAVRTALDAGTF